ncbi:hypothetical protein HID58_036745 [Brassica napus]|uniref:GOLD domain-containing protein n=1 Tax=Brassica napus TaxID=3708 RepID=A0ABQ8C8N6_BRANA|nr:hypothetical protein HID58_036745 [Brassica napus]
MAAKMSSGLLTGLLLFFLVLVMIQVGEAILQDMPPTDTRCLNFPYNKNISINVGRCKTTQKEKIEGMEVEIRKLEGTVKAIHENLLKLINGDADVITVSANTNTLLASYSVMAVIICIMVSVYQVVCLKAYIEANKLT